MMQWVKALPLYRKALYLLLIIIALLLLWQVAVQQFFVGNVREIYETNVNYVMEDIVNDIKDALNRQSEALAQIIQHDDVKVYAATLPTDQRYSKAYGAARPVILTATSNLNITHVLVFDNTKAWYQFVGGLTPTDCRTLRSTFWDAPRQVDTLISLEDGLHLCSAAPIWTSDNYMNVMQVGLAVAMSNLDDFQGLLNSFQQLNAGIILLHDGQKVLLSNTPGMAGLALSEVPRDKEKYIIREETVLQDALQATVLLPHSQVFPKQSAFSFALLAAGFFSILTFLVAWLLISRWLLRPYSKILKQLDALGDQNPNNRVQETGLSHMDVLVRNINGMLSRIEHSNRFMLDAQQHLYEARLQKQHVEMYLLRKQIDSHFLYNSLISIKYLYDKGENQNASEVLQGIAALLRYAHDINEYVPVFDEMSIIQRYANIMNIRFGHRFEVNFDVDDCLIEYQMLKMLLQPLVENALVHGLDSSQRPCVLDIKGELMDDAILFTVRDNGCGIAEGTLEALHCRMNVEDMHYEYLDIEGVSLMNIQRRIQTAYGAPYGLTIDSKLGAYTVATVRIPKREITKEDV